MASKLYCWDVRNIAKLSPKMAHSQNLPKKDQKTVIFHFFSIFSKTVHTSRTKMSTVFFYTTVWSMCAISINSYNWDWSESEGKRPKTTPLPHMLLWSTTYPIVSFFFSRPFHENGIMESEKQPKLVRMCSKRLNY